MNSRYDAFVSYSSGDREIVTALVESLRRDGFTVWFDVDDMTVGAGVVIQLADAVDVCRHTIVCLSDGYIAGQWTSFEVQATLYRDPAARTPRTIPVLIRNLTVDLPNYLRHIAMCDLTDPHQHRQQYERIVRQLRASASEESPAPDRDDVEKASTIAFEHLDDPALTLFHVRRATVGLAKLLYRQRLGDVPADITLDRLIELLLLSGKLPQDASGPLALLHAFGRYAVREQIEDIIVTREMVAPAINALRMLTDWTFPERRAQQTWAEIWDSLPVGNSLSERRIPDTPYRLLEPRLSRNSLGPLYAGIDTDRRESVSVNLVTLPPSSESRFFEEVSRFRRLNAANVISPRDAGRVVVAGERRCLYLVMPAIDGVGVQELVERDGPLPESAAYDLCLGVATALVGFHEADPPIVHGDIKPASVIVSNFGAVGVLCIGHQVASAPTAALSQNADGRIDSFHFSSPEQRHGRPLTPMTDLFALRAMLAYLLTGTHPSPGMTAPEASLVEHRAALAVLGRLATCHTAVEACRVLRDALRDAPLGAPDGRDFRSIVRGHLPSTAPWRPAIDQPHLGQLHLVDVCPIASRLSWPLDDGGVLVWELGTGTLAVLRGTELFWRDAGPLPVRKTATGAGGRLAVGGWNGAVRCFTHGALSAAATLDGAIGDLRYSGNDLIVGAWNRALRRISDDGVVRDLLAVERGVHRIAVGERGGRFAVADQSGGLAFYAEDRRVDMLPALGPVADIAYAGGRLVVLTQEAVSAVRLDGTRTDPVATPGAFALGPAPEPGCCLLLVSTNGEDPAGPTVQAWRIDDKERRLASFTLAAGDRLLSMSAAGHRLTVKGAAGGCVYRRDGIEVLAWPDALAAHVSGDGRRIAVSRPARVELYEDPA